VRAKTKYQQSDRLTAAAKAIQARGDLGPPAFRGAIAVWLDQCGKETRRMIDNGLSLPTLPCVETILDVIEARP
jgi:hypothetical protein